MTLKNWFYIALRGTLFIYAPVLFTVYALHYVIFRNALIIHWVFIILSLLIFLRWIIATYKHQAIEETLHTFNGLDKMIDQDRWEICDQSQTEMVVKPTFDVPFSWVLNSKLQLTYAYGVVRMEGPDFYVRALAETVRGEPGKKTKKSTELLKFAFAAVLAVIPILSVSNILWNIDVMRHNASMNVVGELHIPFFEGVGNLPENSINGGSAVETDDYLFYVENDLDLVRMSKDFQEKEVVEQRETGYGFGQLNVVDDFLYYTRGEQLERRFLDGSHQAVLYDLSFLSDMTILNDSIYFLNWEDDRSIYSMDLNGRNVEQLISGSAISLAVHDNRLLVGTDNRNNPSLESYDLEGRDRQVVFEDYVQDLMVWDAFYYYRGDDYKLYRITIGEETDRQLVIDESISSYIPTEYGIIYSVHSESSGSTGSGLYRTDLDGNDTTLLSAADNVEGLAAVGDSVLFSATERYGQLSKRRLDLTSMTIDHLN